MNRSNLLMQNPKQITNRYRDRKLGDCYVYNQKRTIYLLKITKYSRFCLFFFSKCVQAKVKQFQTKNQSIKNQLYVVMLPLA